MSDTRYKSDMSIDERVMMAMVRIAERFKKNSSALVKNWGLTFSQYNVLRVLDASENGACILNHTMMTDFLIKDSTVYGIQAKDLLSGEDYLAHGRIVLNAGGAWADIVQNKLNLGGTNGLRKTKGIHLLTRKISNNALVLFAKSDGRLFFVIPWEGYSLVGTTDTDYTGDLDTVHADASDVNYLVSEICRYFPDFKRDNIYYTMAGLRPLVTADRKAESNTSRAHKLVDHELRDGKRHFISVLGGKITAYRAIAEEAIDLVCRKLSRKLPCSTAYTSLPGAPAVYTQDMENLAKEKGLPLETITHLAAIYGSRFSSVLNYASEDERLVKPIAPGYRDILAQIKHAVIEEQALSVSDFMLRRSAIGLGASQGLDAIDTVAREMGAILGWSDKERQNQIDAYRASAALGRHFTERADNTV